MTQARCSCYCDFDDCADISSCVQCALSVFDCVCTCAKCGGYGLNLSVFDDTGRFIAAFFKPRPPYQEMLARVEEATGLYIASLLWEPYLFEVILRTSIDLGEHDRYCELMLVYEELDWLIKTITGYLTKLLN